MSLARKKAKRGWRQEPRVPVPKHIVFGDSDSDGDGNGDGVGDSSSTGKKSVRGERAKKPTSGLQQRSGERREGKPAPARTHPHRKQRRDVEDPAATAELQRVAKGLPIYKHREELIELVKKQQFTIVVGETGSGKTTQLPQYLYDGGVARKGGIACTQPRRVAAITVAQRVARERGGTVGGEVGYAVRFDECTSRSTALKFVTDGMLLRECMSDPQLLQYDVIVLDEAHERTIHTDVLFALIKRLATERKNLKVVIMSATLQSEVFVSYFEDKITPFFVKGRTFPVEVMYTVTPQQDYLQACLVTIAQIHQGKVQDDKESEFGDILVFLSGQDEIESLERMIKDALPQMPDGLKELLVCPMYGALPPQQQLLAFNPAPPNTRKVILATNIAETSITIHGIKYVIDPGVVKQRSFNAKAHMDVLKVVPVSKAQARQRCGRAGRHTSGFCFRLYCEETFFDLAESTRPEISRCNLDGVVLQLLALNVDNIFEFDFITPPPIEALAAALETLHALEAVGDNGRLTKLGKKMANFPVEPKLAKVLLNTSKFHCLEEILSIVSLLSVDGLFVQPHKGKEKAEQKKRIFVVHDGDHSTLLKAYRAAKKTKMNKRWCYEHFINTRTLKTAMDTQKQLASLCERLGVETSSSGDDTEAYRKCLASGFFLNIAMLQPDLSYKVVKTNQECFIHPSSVLFHINPRPACVLFNELVLTNKRYMRNCCVINPMWLCDVAPNAFAQTARDGSG